jgi:hypothetical protein
MNIIASFFLGAKHWQLFLLSVALVVVTFAAVASNSAVLGSETVTRVVFGALYRVLFFGWMWAAGTFLNELLSDTLERDPTPFYFSLAVPFVFGVVSDAVVAPKETPPTWLFAGWGLTFFCLFYAFGFVADALRRVETGKTGTFGGMAKYFFGIWFFVVGVWWIQPKINRYYAANTLDEGRRRRE